MSYFRDREILSRYEQSYLKQDESDCIGYCQYCANPIYEDTHYIEKGFALYCDIECFKRDKKNEIKCLYKWGIKNEK